VSVTLPQERPATEESDSVRWIENRSTRPWWSGIRVAEWWTYRELGIHLALRDLKVRYKQTLFGVAWAVLRPLLSMGVFSVIFGHFAKLPSDRLPYPVFVLTGLAIWGFISTAVDAAAHSLAGQRELVEKVWFPRVIAPLAALLAPLVDLLIALVLVAIAMAAWGVAPTLALLTLPAWIGLAFLVAAGVSLWLAALNVLYRDVQYALSFILQLWLYASPVIYPSSLTHGLAGWLFALNPAVVVVDGLRWSMISDRVPPTHDLISAATTLLILITGLLYFTAVERRFADRI
jgi:homopolymeric O-antigen transport system permease protein